MTKKKPSPQNRVWEKERRDRLNQTFDSLSKLLPEYEPATQLSKIEILQRTIEYVEKLQDKIKAFLEERDALLKKHVDELEERLQVLIARNEDLAALLKKANINVPPCKVGSPISGKDSPVEKQDVPTEPDGSNKKPSPKQKKILDKEVTKVKETSGKTDSTSVIETTSSGGSSATSTAVSTSEISSKSVETVTVVTVSNVTETTVSSAVTTSVPGTCLIMANNQIVGTLNQSNGVNVTPALLPTPIMATGVIISNNGNLLQMPLAVPPTSSLLIVSNEDVRSKLSLRKKRRSGSSFKPPSGKANPSRKRKFSIKSIDVIPGRIVNGKIPIPPLKRPPPTGRTKKEVRKMRRKRKASDQKENGEIAEVKKVKLNDKKSEIVIEKPAEEAKESEDVKKSDDQPSESITQIQEREPPQADDRVSSLEMNLDQGDLSADIFANLQVPDEVPDGNQGSLSPTAAYLMNFPLVSTGGKASSNHVEGSGEVESTDCVEGDKKTSQQTADTSLLLDNFSSYFNPSIYAGLDSVIQPTAEIPTTSAAASTSFSTIYQSIDSMLEHKTPRVTVSSDCRYNTTPFTFTLTSTSNTVSTQSYDHRHSSSSNYFYPTTASTTKPIDDFCLPKPPIVSEFTFSLTSTIQSGPKTVQSQYTNSTIFSSTITTPSYSTYGYQAKSNKTANYNSNYFPEASKPESKTPKKYDFLEAEKPATSFTFSLTSTTKTNPKYTYPPAVASSLSYTTPYVTTSASSCTKIEDCLYKASKSSANSQNLYKTPSKQKVNHYPTVSTVQSTFATQTSTHSQSKYDVNWMTSQDPKPPTNNQDYSQLLPSLDFNATASHSYQTSNIDLSRKSDIFFAHPSGEDNLVTWSPNKLTNILNDTSSSFYPSTTTSLPNLHGDLALNCPLTTSKLANQQRKPNDSVSTFLSVQQLVDQPRKTTTSKNYSSCNNYSINQKPLNNNYSAEALIGTSTGSSSKKDKYYVDASYNSYSTYQSETNSGAGLSFNFDYSTDYGKNYNYSCQQNYMPSFVDNSYGLSTIASATLTTPSSSSFPVTSCYASYGYSSDKKQQSSSTGSYYQNSSYQSASVPDIPYYVPVTEKRTLPSNPTAKPKKHHKHPPSNDYSSFPPTFPTILPPPPPPSLPPPSEDPLGYNVVTTTSYQQPYQGTMPNYSFGSQSYPSAAVGGSSSTLTNFNLSTICPEINEKNGPSNNGGGLVGAAAAVIGGAVSSRHGLAGVGGW